MAKKRIEPSNGGFEMKVFLSWSGERSRELALAIKEWLPLVLHYVEPWVSDADIEAGERWAQSVAKELAASNFGIICVTSENINSPWVLFEAGALTKSLETSRVIPLLLDLEFSDVSGPLAQFQSKKLSRQGIGEVVQSIQKVAEKPDAPERAAKLFENLWPALETQLAAIPKEPPAEREVRPTTEILEELVASVRALDSRMREFEDVGSPRWRRGKRSRGRMHPMMVQDFARMVGNRPGDPIQFLMVASLFRDDLPWLYELAVDAYRAIREKRNDSSQAFERMRKAFELTLRGPFPIEEFGIDPEMIFVALHDLERYYSHLEPVENTNDESDENDQ